MAAYKGMAEEAAEILAQPIPRNEYAVMLMTLVVLTVADTVLCTVNLYYYTEVYAQFFNQGTGIVYILVSIPIVVIRRRWQKEREGRQGQLQGLLNQPAPKPGPPLWILICIGALNGTGNFFNAVGSPGTRADTQSLLQLVGIPIVLALSWLFMGKRPSLIAALGAALIVAGTFVSALPAIKPDWFTCGTGMMNPACAPSSGTASSGGSGSAAGGSGAGGFKEQWLSVAIYFCAQLFYSTEKVFEEMTFGRFSIDLFYMFFWTLVTQVMHSASGMEILEL